MAGQVAHEGIGDLLGVAGDRQVDAQDLGLLVVAQHVVAQHAAVQADLELDPGHAEIVAGDVIDLGRPLVDADRLGELDGRRQVGDDVQLPVRLLVAARLKRDLLALGDDLLDLVLALADGRELGALAVDHQLRRLAAAHVVDEAGELAADRHAQQLVVLGHVEIDRRLAGIGGRRDPQIGNHRRRRRESRREGGNHAVVAPAAGDGERHDQGEDRHEAQRPGVEDGQTGTRRLVGEPGQPRRLTATMGLPQGCGHRVVLARGQAILHGDQWPVRHPAVEFEAADRGFARGPGKIPQTPPAERAQGERQDSQHAGMNPGIEAGEKLEMGRSDEQGDKSQQRHQTRP